MTTYTAQVFRDSGQWVIEVPELGAVSQTRSLRSAAQSVRDLIAVWLDVPADSFDVDLDFSRINPEAVCQAHEARERARLAEELTKEAAASWRKAAHRLVVDDGLSVRDAAEVLGVSYGRVQQLVGSRK